MSSNPTSSNNSSKSLPKTLSKKAVYLPLVALDHKVDGQYKPDAYLDSRTSLPGSVQEKSLVDFWHKVSVHFHRNSDCRESRNNGNRPKSLAAIEESIRSRALGLIGGGIHTGWDTTTTATTASNTPTPRNHKLTTTTTIRRRNHQRQTKKAMHFSTTNDKETREMTLFLVHLNKLWNDYMVDFLRLPSTTTLSDYQRWTRDTQTWARVTSSVTNETFQIVGARVKIKACLHSPAWIGRIGYIVGKTKNTWNVMVESPVLQKKKKKRRGKQSDASRGGGRSASGEGDDKKIKGSVGWKSLVVPKRGSELTLLIPIELQGKSSLEENGQSRDNAANEQVESSPVLAIDIREDGDEK